LLSLVTGGVAGRFAGWNGQSMPPVFCGAMRSLRHRLVRPLRLAPCGPAGTQGRCRRRDPGSEPRKSWPLLRACGMVVGPGPRMPARRGPVGCDR